MTHKYAGKYTRKHPPGTKPDEGIAKAIQEYSKGGEFTCGMAEKIAREMKVDMSEVGMAADLMEIKIKKCQLGLFGWGKEQNHGKEIQAASSVSGELKQALEEVAESGRVTCASAWQIADRVGIERRAVSSACEALGLKIRACQLGTF